MDYRGTWDRGAGAMLLRGEEGLDHGHELDAKVVAVHPRLPENLSRVLHIVPTICSVQAGNTMLALSPEAVHFIWVAETLDHKPHRVGHALRRVRNARRQHPDLQSLSPVVPHRH